VSAPDGWADASAPTVSVDAAHSTVSIHPAAPNPPSAVSENARSSDGGSRDAGRSAAIDVSPPSAPNAVAPESGNGSADAPAAELGRLRGEIERIDRQIVGLIAERVAVARRVGPVKQALGMPILDPPREASIVRRAGEIARAAGLDDEDVRYVFWHLVGLSRRVQLEEG
jgi:chorismate mutase